MSVERQGLEEVGPVGEAVVIIAEREHGAYNRRRACKAGSLSRVKGS